MTESPKDKRTKKFGRSRRGLNPRSSDPKADAFPLRHWITLSDNNAISRITYPNLFLELNGLQTSSLRSFFHTISPNRSSKVQQPPTNRQQTPTLANLEGRQDNNHHFCHGAWGVPRQGCPRRKRTTLTSRQREKHPKALMLS